MTGTRVAAVVPAAGLGTRFGSAENKIWARVHGRSLIEWTLSALDSHPGIAVIVVAGNPLEIERLRTVCADLAKPYVVVPGGASRQESVGRGLEALPDNCGIVLVHDAARPAVSHALVSRVIEGVEKHGAAVPGIPVTDTLKRADADGSVLSTVDRDGLWAVQTPQGVRLELLRAAYDALGPRVDRLTDEAGVLEAAGCKVHIVPGDDSNIKVTRPADLDRAAAMLAADVRAADVLTAANQGDSGPGSTDHPITQLPDHPDSGTGIPLTTPLPSSPAPLLSDIRVGFGYDVHPFAADRELWLGGVRIPHCRGLAGHSDADALLHAVCDALLGAAGLGDIGVLFPDTDRAHKDRPSVEFLGEVRGRLSAAGWGIVNVDVSLLAEAPRIGPFRDAMRHKIAGSLGIDAGRVNIKATTSEKMGFVGREEGIACWAVATLTSSGRSERS